MMTDNISNKEDTMERPSGFWDIFWIVVCLLTLVAWAYFWGVFA